MTLPTGNAAAALWADLTQTLGLTTAQAAGVEGNAKVESNASTTSGNAKEGAIGIFQWEGGRRTALDQYASAHGLAETDIAAQIGYLNQELTGPYAYALAAVKGQSTAAGAAGIFNNDYEHSQGTQTGSTTAGASTPQRVASANAIYAAGGIGGGTVPAGTGPGATSSSSGTGIDASILGPVGTALGGVGSLIPGVSGIEGDIVNAVEALAAPLVKWIIRAFVVIVGVVILIIAIVLLSKTMDGTAADESESQDGSPNTNEPHPLKDSAGVVAEAALA